MYWYLAPSLVNLRVEIDRLWPGRDRRTDGAVADPAVRTSYGHNPDGKGCVHAIDVDVDGIEPAALVRWLTTGPGPLLYVIWDRRIWSRDHGFAPRPYDGESPHTDHLHIEIARNAAAETYTGPWGVPSLLEGGSPMSLTSDQAAQLSAVHWALTHCADPDGGETYSHHNWSAIVSKTLERVEMLAEGLRLTLLRVESRIQTLENLLERPTPQGPPPELPDDGFTVPVTFRGMLRYGPAETP